MGVCVTGCGKAQPGLAVKNADLEKIVDTSDEWILTRTGIEERRISVNETGLDLSDAASCRAMGLPSPDFDDTVNIDSEGMALKALRPSDIDLIIITTLTPDTLVPSAASALKKRLGCENAIAFDMNAACTGFIYGLSVAESMMEASHAHGGESSKMPPIEHALVVSAERLSRVTNWPDRNTCVLFGDGAGAVALEWVDGKNQIESMYLENTDDDGNSLTCLNNFDSPLPFDKSGVLFEDDFKELGGPRDYGCLDSQPERATVLRQMRIDADDDELTPNQVIRMNGQKVFKFASKAMEKAVREVAALANIDIEDIDLVVPHQANYRIIEYAAKRLSLPIERFQISIDHTGNSSSSCLPMALTEALMNGRIGEGTVVCLVAFGGGLTSGAIIIRF